MKEFFENTDPENCPILICELKTASCGATYFGKLRIIPNDTFDFVLISSNNDFKLEKINACILCSNGYESINFENFEINYITNSKSKNDGIPEKIFTIVNLNYPLKLKNILQIELSS